MKGFFKELLHFGIKQAYASLFGCVLLFFILLTEFYYPFSDLHRFDFLLIIAVVTQAFLIFLKLETAREVLIILVFHIVATCMELFKTSNAIGSWSYPDVENALFAIAGVPLFAGFMYSAVGSYICRIWRLFDMSITPAPDIRMTSVVALLIYINFFTHHYFYDVRWILIAASLWLYGRTVIRFKITEYHWKMPTVVGLLLVSFFIWIAENAATFGSVWLYPDQKNGWQFVSMTKIVAWYLLLLISYELFNIFHFKNRK